MFGLLWLFLVWVFLLLFYLVVRGSDRCFWIFLNLLGRGLCPWPDSGDDDSEAHIARLRGCR